MHRQKHEVDNQLECTQARDDNPIVRVTSVSSEEDVDVECTPEPDEMVADHGPASTLAAVIAMTAIDLPDDSTIPETAQQHGDFPTLTYCSSCQKKVVSRTKKQIGIMTFIGSFVFCFVGCVFGCCLIPFFTDSTKDTVHSCPGCGKKIATVKQCGCCG